MAYLQPRLKKIQTRASSFYPRLPAVRVQAAEGSDREDSLRLFAEMRAGQHPAQGLSWGFQPGSLPSGRLEGGVPLPPAFSLPLPFPPDRSKKNRSTVQNNNRLGRRFLPVWGWISSPPQGGGRGGRWEGPCPGGGVHPAAEDRHGVPRHQPPGPRHLPHQVHPPPPNLVANPLRPLPSPTVSPSRFLSVVYLNAISVFISIMVNIQSCGICFKNFIIFIFFSAKKNLQGFSAPSQGVRAGNTDFRGVRGIIPQPYPSQSSGRR